MNGIITLEQWSFGHGYYWSKLFEHTHFKLFMIIIEQGKHPPYTAMRKTSIATHRGYDKQIA